MGEHNTEDARSSVPPRRGPRPFVGPSGAPGQALPLLRATPTRPAPRPFAPAPGSRPSLGTTPRPVAPAAPAAPATPVATAPNVTAEAPAPAVEMPTAPEPAALAELPSPEAPAAPVVPASPVAATPVWLAAQTALPETSDTLEPPTVDHSAPDRYAAFDVTWQDEPVVDATASQATDASLLDVAALGSGHTDELWAGDIVSEIPPAQPAESPVPAWLMDDADPVPIVHVTGAAEAVAGDIASGEPDLVGSEGEAAVDASMLDASWTDVTIMPSADAIMAAGLEATGGLVDGEASDTWPDPLLAEYAPYVPTPTTVAPVAPAVPFEAVAAAPAESMSAAAPMASADLTASLNDAAVAEPPAVAEAPSVEAAPSHESRVAASLDRLAERVRDGQIDVSSVAPEGPDAAVLAAVLAALLGGGRSSSR